MAIYYARLKLKIDDNYKDQYKNFYYTITVYKSTSAYNEYVNSGRKGSREIITNVEPATMAPFDQNWQTIDTQIADATDKIRIFYDIYIKGCNTPIHTDIECPRYGLPYDKDPEKNITPFTIKLTKGDTCQKGKTVEQVIQQLMTNVLIFYIGGAADKDKWAGGLIGPNGNIAYVKDQILAKWIEPQSLDQKRYQGVYLGYDEISDNDKQKKIIKTYITNRYTVPQRKYLKIIVIGHSLGGWNGAHFIKKLVSSGFPVECLITLDPVGISGAVHLVASLIPNYPTSPNAKEWINVTVVKRHDLSDDVALLGGRWIPGYKTVKKVVGLGAVITGFAYDSTQTSPNISFIADIAHGFAWSLLSDNNVLSKSTNCLDKSEIGIQHTIIENAPVKASPWNILAHKLRNWLKS